MHLRRCSLRSHINPALTSRCYDPCWVKDDLTIIQRIYTRISTEIFNLILDVASGIKEPYSDQYGFHNDICIFNPAPIT